MFKYWRLLYTIPWLIIGVLWIFITKNYLKTDSPTSTSFSDYPPTIRNWGT